MRDFSEKMPLESAVQTPVVRYAESKGCLAYKFRSPGNRSVPDYLFIAPNGPVMFVEFKRPGKTKVRPAQALEINKLLRHGQNVSMCNDIEQGKKLIDGLLAL